MSREMNNNKSSWVRRIEVVVIEKSVINFEIR
jgi:hypothetical protein